MFFLLQRRIRLNQNGLRINFLKKREEKEEEKQTLGQIPRELLQSKFVSLKTSQRYVSRGNCWLKTKDHYQKIIEILHKQVNHPFRK